MLGLVKAIVALVFLFAPATMSFATNTGNMHLLGQGKAYYLGFIKVYDAYFYSEQILPESDILNSGVSKCLRLEYAVDVGRKDFITAANKVLSRQFTPERLKTVEKELNALHDGYKDVKEGDSYSLCYRDADETTTLSLNGAEIVAIPSAEFAEIYFSIWLGSSNPLDKDLRNNLLAAARDASGD
jgi:hypothetical protein